MSKRIPYADAMTLINLRKFRIECLSRKIDVGLQANLETDYVYFPNTEGTFFSTLKKDLLDGSDDFVIYLALTKQKKNGELTPEELKELKIIVGLYEANEFDEALALFLEFQKKYGQLVETVILTGRAKDAWTLDTEGTVVMFDFGGHCCN